MIETKSIHCCICGKTFEYISDKIDDDRKYIEEFGWKYNSMKSRWACPNCIDKERKNNDLEFVAHLDECSAIVSGWSKWKQMLFGRK